MPICKRYNANLVQGIGLMAITSVITLLKRIQAIGKPTRILYVSDYDPSGYTMPTQVARQIEYWLDDYCSDGDIKLEPIVLTRGQIERDELPPTPIKDAHPSKANFEKIHGEGGVELDALEASHPELLGKTVVDRISEYRDRSLIKRYDEARDLAGEYAEAWNDSITREYQPKIDEITANIETVVETYERELVRLHESLARDLEPFKYELDSLENVIDDSINDCVDVDLPDLPHAVVHPDDDDWLFDSSRDYIEQMKYYKNRQNGMNRMNGIE